jgi:hypothetical protein
MRRRIITVGVGQIPVELRHSDFDDSLTTR